MRPRTSALLVIACLSLARPAAAQDFDLEGVYAGLGFNYGKISDATPLDSTYGGGLWLGYRGLLVPWLAPEVQIDVLAAKESVGAGLDAVLAYATGTVNLRVYPIDALGIEILGGRIQPYALGGIGLLYARVVTDLGPGTDVEQTATEVAGRIAAGVDLYVTNSFSLLGEVGGLLVGGDGGVGSSEVLMIRAGAQFQF